MSCCEPLIRRVVGVNANSNPVLLTINKPFSELAENNCFKLLIQICSLTSINTNPVSLIDSDGTVHPLIQGCTGNVVRYDQLVKAVNVRRGWCEYVLNCYFGNDGAPSGELHVVCNTKLPCTTYVS